MPASTKENSEKLYRQKFHSPIWNRSAKVSAGNSVLEMKSRPILKCGDIHNFKISHMTIKCYWSVRDSVSFSPFVPQFHDSHLLQQFHFPHLVPLFHVSHLVLQFKCSTSSSTLSCCPSCSKFSCLPPFFTVSCSRLSGSHIFQIFIIS